VAVSVPVFARFKSIDFFGPSKTTLLGVIRRFPCALRLAGERSKIPNIVDRIRIRDLNLQEWLKLPE
jgi:hypothetical protein